MMVSELVWPFVQLGVAGVGLLALGLFLRRLLLVEMPREREAVEERHRQERQQDRREYRDDLAQERKLRETHGETLIQLCEQLKQRNGH